MKLFKYILGWFALLVYLVVGLGFVSTKQRSLVCDRVEVRIIDSLKNRFVEPGDITRLLERERIQLIGQRVEKINTSDLEALLGNHPPVKRSEVFRTVDGRVVIDIWQREPIARVIARGNEGFYLDREGTIMALSSKYTSHVLVMNGNIPGGFKPGTGVSGKEKRGVKGPVQRDHPLTNLYRLASFIHHDEFWKSQVQQLHVNARGEHELIPRVGAHVILLGSLDDFEEKLERLKTLYKSGFNNVGWNQYEIINLKYKGQVICTKR